MKSNINIGIVGASGLVGRTILDVLLERQFQYNFLKLFASSNSAGKVIISKNQKFLVEGLSEFSFRGLDIVFFAAGGKISKQFVPIAVNSGCIVIDNSSYFRMNDSVPLVVPEVNPFTLQYHNGIIANPNCSTIQLVILLDVLLKLCNISRIIVSTYQAVGGGGQK